VKILLDHGTPRQLAKYLIGHDVTRLAWNELQNGELIAAAEAAGFDLMISSDQKIKDQQNLTTRKLALIVLGTNRRATIESFSSPICGCFTRGAIQLSVRRTARRNTLKKKRHRSVTNVSPPVRILLVKACSVSQGDN
jgi:hypothetical protein